MKPGNFVNDPLIPTEIARAHWNRRDVLKAEGFTDLQYVKFDNTGTDRVRSGAADITLDTAAAITT